MGVVYTAEGDGHSLAAKMLEKIGAQGGSVSAGEGSGEFSVQGFSGVYAVNDGKLTIEITKKPVFVPDSMIEAWLRQNMG